MAIIGAKILTQHSVDDEAGLAAAAALLRAGRLVAFPTETVYGLGADASSGAAVAGIYEAKERPSFNPLISHVFDLEQAEREGDFSPQARALAQAFWPGPLTLVVPVAKSGTVSDLARAGLSSVALRVPAHPIARRLIERTRRPIAAPSANISGHVSPTLAAHVAADLDGRIEMIIDGGACGIGVESTIVSCLGGQVHLLRPGAVTRQMIEGVLGRRLDEARGDADRPVAPGQLLSHYAPSVKVRLNARAPLIGEVFLDFGGTFAGAAQDLSPSSDLIEAAANLFAALRVLDKSGAAGIAVAPIPHDGLGEAINERLARAAAAK